MKAAAHVTPAVGWRALLALALIYTLLNAPKPLLIDDAAYYYYARQITRDPLRPYDFSMFWYQWPHPANQVLAPPVLPYWWAVAYQLFGERPFLWKLWLFPFALLFVVALNALCRRFARGQEMPLLLLTILSPTFLPSLNLMLDVPALALSLGGVVLFFRACARRSFPLAVAAGLVAGVGMETKYTAFIAPAVMLLYAVLFRRVVHGGMAAGAAAIVFTLWEFLIEAYHGQSHFAVNVGDQGSTLADKFNLVTPLLSMIGGLVPAVMLLGLVALRVRGEIVALWGAGLGLGYVIVAYFKGVFWFEAGSQTPALAALNTVMSLESLLFGVFGLIALFITVLVISAIFLDRDEEEADVELVSSYPWWQSPFLRVDVFLFLWFLGEVAAYFVLTPFPAVRRVMGLMMVGTLLVGRLASRTCTSGERRALVWGVTTAGVVLGFGFYGVDMLDACASKELAEASAAYVRQREPEARIWYVGHWGFQYYAERAGMIPVVPAGSATPASRLETGDWLVVPEPRLNQQTIFIDLVRTEGVIDLVVRDGVPLRTVQCFYGGFAPLEHHDGPRARVTIYRVVAPFTAQSQ
jgi:hypothetical protein